MTMKGRFLLRLRLCRQSGQRKTDWLRVYQVKLIKTKFSAWLEKLSDCGTSVGRGIRISQGHTETFRGIKLLKSFFVWPCSRWFRMVVATKLFPATASGKRSSMELTNGLLNHRPWRKTRRQTVRSIGPVTISCFAKLTTIIIYSQVKIRLGIVTQSGRGKGGEWRPTKDVPLSRKLQLKLLIAYWNMFIIIVCSWLLES